MVMSAHALLEHNPKPSDGDVRTALTGNLCRCTGYAQILESVQLAASRKRGEHG
jgi:aerobic-type carbon monoxide dehydrogenase small subunit (CoxS/CutS family)